MGKLSKALKKQHVFLHMLEDLISSSYAAMGELSKTVKPQVKMLPAFMMGYRMLKLLAY